MKNAPSLQGTARSCLLAAAGLFAAAGLLTTRFGEGNAHAQTSADLLPDLLVDRLALLNTRIDQLTLPGRRLLRLSASTPNVGAGPLEIRGSTPAGAEQPQVLQRIYRADGSSWDRLAGTSSLHPTQGYSPFEGWAVYRLRSVLADGTAGPVLAEGANPGFCWMDSVPSAAPPQAGTKPEYISCGQTVQGISPGWADVHDRELDGQWIDVTDLPEGAYWLEAEVDPEQRLLEQPGGEANNRAQVPIVLGPETGAAGAAAVESTAPASSGAALNQPPQVDFLSPSAALTWVEHTYEGLPVQWSTTDPEGDPVRVGLFVDRDRSSDAARLPLGGYQGLPAETGQAVINTAALALGVWNLFAVASDGVTNRGAWAQGSIVVYIKGDLNFDGRVDRADWVMLVQRRRQTPGMLLGVVTEGWEQALDLDRNAVVDAADIDAFRSLALRAGGAQ